MKKIGLLLPLFALVLLAGCAQKEITSDAQTDTGVAEKISAKVVASGDVDVIIAASVVGHADATSCWTIISGNVYDLTSFIGKHPGGDKAILSSCGKDATEAFDTQHGMDPKKWEGLENFRVMLK